jgi:ribosome recycling factor
MARVNSASPSKSWANVKKVNEQKKMKISEFRKLIPEEIKRTLKEKSNTNDATKGSQLNEINLNQDQEKLLKDLYSVIKNYYSTLSNPQVVGTIDQLKDLYI